MTDKQLKFFYFKTWNRCASANNWRMHKGRLQAQPPQHATCNTQHDDLLCKVWQCASTLANAQHRAITPDDLRHAIHIVVLTPTNNYQLTTKNLAYKSARDLTNKECDQVVNAFRLLADPEDLDAVLDYQNPAESERKRLVHAIKKLAPFAYIDAIAAAKFRDYNTPFYEDLPINELRMLHITLKNRKPGASLRAHEENPDTCNIPF